MGTPIDDRAVSQQSITWNGKACTVARGRVIIRLKAESTSDARTTDFLANSLLKHLPNGRIRSCCHDSRFICYDVAPNSDLAELMTSLQKLDDIEVVEPDYVGQNGLDPNDARYSEQWHFPRIKAPEAWDISTGSRDGVLLGIMDGGVSLALDGTPNHPDMIAERYILGSDFVDDSIPRDTNGHGTHVAGILAAASNNSTGVVGTNWGTQLYVTRVSNDVGDAQYSWYAAAIRETVDKANELGMRLVMNISQGGTSDSALLREACEYAVENEALLVACTHNDSDRELGDLQPIRFPARYAIDLPTIIAVGATNPTDGLYSRSNGGPEISVVAPGIPILSTTPPYEVYLSQRGLPRMYGRMAGTSMATPQVAGLASLIWGRDLSLTAAQVKEAIIETAEPLCREDFSEYYGHGIINCEAALAYWDTRT